MSGMGTVTLSYVCLHCSCFPLDDYIWWVFGHGDGNNRNKKHCGWWCVQHAGGQYEWRASNRVLVVLIGAEADRAKVFKAHAVSLGLCDNLIIALKLLANQQKDGESPIQRIATGLFERSRRGIMDGRRSFIEQPQCCGRGWLAPRYLFDPGEETAVQRCVPRGGLRRWVGRAAAEDSVNADPNDGPTA